MYSKRLVVAVLALTLAVMGFGMAAYAGQACSAGKSASCAKAADCPKDMKVTMTGTIEVKTEGNAKTAYLKVSEAKCEKGKACEGMAGKEIKLGGAKASEAEKLAGKTVEVQGTCKAGKELEVASLAEKK